MSDLSNIAYIRSEGYQFVGFYPGWECVTWEWCRQKVEKNTDLTIYSMKVWPVENSAISVYDFYLGAREYFGEDDQIVLNDPASLVDLTPHDQNPVGVVT